MSLAMTSGGWVDLAPAARVALAGAALALLAVVWTVSRVRGGTASSRLQAVTALTLFLTFDLVAFGAYTRLTDSGLGCPDWPGCYGHGSPVGAAAPITSAESALPDGPVTHDKAWIEMVHRYLATAVGALIVGLAATNAWRAFKRQRPAIPGWAVLSLVWVGVQGAFGAWTVTWKLYPAIVTAHLLGGMVLLALLAVQNERQARRALVVPAALRRGAAVVFVLCLVQVALGGWVSTNEAALACTDVPTCNGGWWPSMDFATGYTLAHPLGRTSDGARLSFTALTAIHVTHRIGAAVLTLAMAALAWRLAVHGGAARRWAGGLAALIAVQALGGVGNVVGGWPLFGALAHTAGAAALVVALATLVARAYGVAGIGLSAMPTSAFRSTQRTGWQRPAESTAVAALVPPQD